MRDQDANRETTRVDGGRQGQIASAHPGARSLGGWSVSDWSDGIQINSCPALEWIVVRTLNSVYDVIVLSGNAGEVLVRGGRFFPEFCRARLAGATAGGGLLKMMGIYVGLRMELDLDAEPIVTSTVQAVSRREDLSRSI